MIPFQRRKAVDLPLHRHSVGIWRHWVGPKPLDITIWNNNNSIDRVRGTPYLISEGFLRFPKISKVSPDLQI